MSSVSGTGGIRDEWTGNSTKKTDSNGNVFNAVFTDDKETTVSANDFLTLMVAQLKNQDFMNPVDDTQFVTQLAQFTTMSQMQELASYAKTSYATSLAGKEVTVAKFNVGGGLDKQTGIVQRVSLVDGKYTIYVNDKTYTLDQIMEVNTAGGSSSSISDKDLLEQAAFAASLIGKEVTVDDGTDKITGIVDKSGLVDGEYKIYIDGNAYSLKDLKAVNGDPVIDNSGDGDDEDHEDGDDENDDVIDNPGTTPPGGGGDIPDIEKPGEDSQGPDNVTDETGTVGESAGNGDEKSSAGDGSTDGGTPEA